MANANSNFPCECHDVHEIRDQEYAVHPQDPSHASVAYSYAQWHHQMALWWWNTYSASLTPNTSPSNNWCRSRQQQPMYPETCASTMHEHCCGNDCANHDAAKRGSYLHQWRGDQTYQSDDYSRMGYFPECGTHNAPSTDAIYHGSNQSGLPEEENMDEDEEDIRLEVHEGFRKFLEISEKHRQERRKQQEMKNENVEYVEVGTVGSKASSEPPQEQPGVQKAEEMKKLYGEDAHKIHSLETALQMHYDLNCDLRHPVYWPSIPLKF